VRGSIGIEHQGNAARPCRFADGQHKIREMIIDEHCIGVAHDSSGWAGKAMSRAGSRWVTIVRSPRLSSRIADSAVEAPGTRTPARQSIPSGPSAAKI
jgi:hypothetical protein